MASQPLNNLPEPKEVSDAVTKKYVDNLIADNVGVGNIDGGGGPFFKENDNYQATHTINMEFKKFLNLSTPSEPYGAATKEYVDDKDASIKKVIDERPHIIVVHAYYHGPLRKDEYQFAFGGSTRDFNGSTGFLVPQ